MARKIRPLTVDRIGDLPDPCSACALWETGGRTSVTCAPADAREDLAHWVGEVRSEWGECGRIAYENGEPLGFVKYAPPRYFPQVTSMPSGVPDSGSVLIACMHVGPDTREGGLGKVLLQAALRDLVARGERVVEAYGASDATDRDLSPLMSVDFLLRQGFTVVRPHPITPLMRLELKSLASWTENIEAVLEALQLPRTVGERVPAPLATPMRTEETRR
jgi:N-acetylglutamate synthase-like GNAT family acetyltransferase